MSYRWVTSRAYVLQMLFLGVFFFLGCAKKNDTNILPPPPPVSLSITSLSVNSGPYNSLIVIKGTGFSSNLANDHVFFNSNPATINAASSTQLTVLVPLAAGTGNVTISVNGKVVTGPVFTYQLSFVVTKLTGMSVSGSVDGTDSTSTFGTLGGIAFNDAFIIVADKGNNKIREITPQGTIVTKAGSGQIGLVNDTGYRASFSGPTGIGIAPNNYIYVADKGNNVVRLIGNQNAVQTFAGNGSYGETDGSPGAATFTNPNALTVGWDSEDVFLVDKFTVRKLTGYIGTVSTIAGTLGNTGAVNGPGSIATFNNPQGLAVDQKNTIYVADTFNNLIREISPQGIVSTLAGSGKADFEDGKGLVASFNNPVAVAVDTLGNVYVADSKNYRIRKIAPNGTVSTIVGTGKAGTFNGPANEATFSNLEGIAVNKAGTIIYVTDAFEVRRISLQ